MLTLDAIKQSAYSLGVIPVIRIEDAALARPLAEALTAGGLPAAEVTFRTAAAADAIAAMREAFPDMLICAGTVLTKQQADDAVRSGASFVVLPASTRKLSPTVSNTTSRLSPDAQLLLILNGHSRWDWTPSNSSQPKQMAASPQSKRLQPPTVRSALCRPAGSMPSI